MLLQPVETESLSNFRSVGVNRLSLGLQSLNDKALTVLGRDHTSREGLQALEVAKKVFPGNVNIDLIFARMNQTPEEWQRELQHALKLADDHLSLYELMVKTGTP